MVSVRTSLTRRCWRRSSTAAAPPGSVSIRASGSRPWTCSPASPADRWRSSSPRTSSSRRWARTTCPRSRARAWRRERRPAGGAAPRGGGFRRAAPAAEEIAEGGSREGPLPMPPEAERPSEARGFFVKFGTGIGYIINTFLAAGRQSINLTLNTILPFMAYVSLLLGFVIYTGIAQAIGRLLAPLSSNPLGLVVIGFVVALPFLSPLLGPGAAVAQIVGVLMGTQIATGALPVQYALPTLFAIDGQVGCDFIPVGLGLGKAKAETVEVGTPAVLFSRMITSPLSVVIAWAASFGL